MIAKATVYLDETRTVPVPEGDKRARFLLVRAGCDIPQAQAERYDGAVQLIGGEKKAAEIPTQEPVEVEHREPQVNQARKLRGA